MASGLLFADQGIHFMADKLEQLKQKYQAAFHFMEQQQVRLQNVNMQGEKLYVRAEAPSEDAKNKVWDQIKLIDPQYSDVTFDITAPQRVAAAGAGGAAQPSQQQVYTVQPGDSLSKIAQRYYGDASHYMRIFEANHDQLTDPNQIQTGRRLVIPGEE
jgi:nucleoid-associated protein YgaU